MVKWVWYHIVTRVTAPVLWKVYCLVKNYINYNIEGHFESYHGLFEIYSGIEWKITIILKYHISVHSVAMTTNSILWVFNRKILHNVYNTFEEIKTWLFAVSVWNFIQLKPLCFKIWELFIWYNVSREMCCYGNFAVPLDIILWSPIENCCQKCLINNSWISHTFFMKEIPI